MRTCVFIIVMILNFNVLHANECVIAKDGKAKVFIVINHDAAKPVVFAAAELKKYLGKITGDEFQIVNSLPQGEKGIFLGDSKIMRSKGIIADNIERDGYVIKSVNGNLYIAGKDDKGKNADIFAKIKKIEKASYNELKTLMNVSNWSFQRGTLYGVYRFLEHFGVCWFVPGPVGEVVPEKKDLVFNGEIKESPYFYTRHISGFLMPHQYRKTSRSFNRDFSEMKALGFTPASNIIWTLRMRGSSMLIPLNHHPPAMTWGKRFGKTHPEYFALLKNGKRDISLKAEHYRYHLCYSNYDVEKEILKEIKAYRSGMLAKKLGIKKYSTRYGMNKGWSPSVAMGKIFSVLPHDSFKACNCQECRKLIAKTGTPYTRLYSKQVWSFVDRFARKVKKSLPEEKITCLAYSSYSEPYEGMKPLPDNVIVGFCANELNRPYSLYYKDNYKKFTDLVEKWNKNSEGPLAFWLHMLYRYSKPRNYAVPLHIPKMYHNVVKVIAKNGRWVFIQQNVDSVMYELYNRYMLMKLLYDPTINPQLIFKDYINKFYGPDAGYIISEIYSDIENRSEKILRARAGRQDIWNKYYTPETIKIYREKINKALKLVKGTKYENAVKLFSQYYVGLIEKGQDFYDKNFRKTLAKGVNKVSFCRRQTKRGEIKIDGILNEKAWQKPVRRVSLVNNVDGKTTKWNTQVAMTQDEKMLYFAFICNDPKALKRQSKNESVEIFLDPNHDHNSYYQLYIDMAGNVTDIFFEGNGEIGNPGWNSNVQTAVKRHNDKWIMEIAIPRSSFPENVKHPNFPWGANFCRTSNSPPKKEDRFSTWSKMVRGSFHQPDCFGHLFFTN